MEEPHFQSETRVGVTDRSMLVTRNGAAFVVAKLVEEAECEWDGATAAA